MFDAFSRAITCLRVSVTDRCNLRCAYCREDDGECEQGTELLHIEEIAMIVAFLVRRGIRKVRLTGGEPLLREDIVSLVQRLSEISDIADLAMTTNGVLLKKYARDLKAAGLYRLNISLDTLDEQRFHRLTNGGRLSDVLDGIRAAQAAGFVGTKLNCVISKSPDEPDARAVGAFGRSENMEVRYIYRMNPSKGEFRAVINGEGGNCGACNRLRLSCTGEIYPCLFSDVYFSIRRLGIAEALKMALQHKPECGHKSSRQFYRIGG